MYYYHFYTLVTHYNFCNENETVRCIQMSSYNTAHSCSYVMHAKHNRNIYRCINEIIFIVKINAECNLYKFNDYLTIQ